MVAFVKGEAKPIRRLNQSKFDGCNKCDYATWCRAAMRNGGEPDLTLLGTDYEALIGTVRNVGYRFMPEEAPELQPVTP